VVLNSSLAKGDKNISIISGERFVFTEENWDKTAYLVVGLDYKLKDDVTTTFKGISGNIKLAWSITFFILAGLFILLFIYHRFILPRPNSDYSLVANSGKDVFREFGRTFSTFFKKPGVALAIVFMLLYRLGEAMLVKMASPFLLDAREVGGLGLTTSQVGLVYGTVGIISLTVGGIIGGFAASRKGLKYWIWPMALSITLPHLAYVYLSWALPTSFILINIAVAIEQFGYGFGFTAYMLYMIYFADGEHKTAHYAICTGFMALGMMLPGMIAGWLQDMFGYQHFFIWIMILAIPTLAVIPFLKIDKSYGKKTPNP
jgi:PAT family beta-lactamase induction signal transducer AmpG